MRGGPLGACRKGTGALPRGPSGPRTRRLQARPWAGAVQTPGPCPRAWRQGGGEHGVRVCRSNRVAHTQNNGGNKHRPRPRVFRHHRAYRQTRIPAPSSVRWRRPGRGGGRPGNSGVARDMLSQSLSFLSHAAEAGAAGDAAPGKSRAGVAQSLPGPICQVRPWTRL